MRLRKEKFSITIKFGSRKLTAVFILERLKRDRQMLRLFGLTGHDTSKTHVSYIPDLVHSECTETVKIQSRE